MNPETAVTTGTGTFVNRDGKWYRVIFFQSGPEIGYEVTPEEVFGPDALRYLMTKPPPEKKP